MTNDVINFGVFADSKTRECPENGSKDCVISVEIARYVSWTNIYEIEFGNLTLVGEKLVSTPLYSYSTGCCGTFCGLCLNYKNAENLGKSGIIYTLLACIMPCVPILLLRQEARERYNIEGGTCDDVVASVCCTSCVMCQVRTTTNQHPNRFT